MSIITTPLAEYVEIDGMQYDIHTDFRNWIKIGALISNPDIELPAKIAETLKLCYASKLPPSLEQAARAMLRFYVGEEQGNKAGRQDGERKSPIYDFEYDGDYIMAAFLGQYNIDLTDCDMHWHKFKALFMGLNGDCKICKIMEYRGIELSKIKDKEQRSFYKRMKRMYRLPDMRTEEEKERDMANSLADAFEI